MSIVKYQLETYITYSPEVGIYDYLAPKSKEFINDLKAVTYNHQEVLTTNLLDAVSEKYYDSEDLWWILAIYNDILNPLDIPDNTIIFIPNQGELEELFLKYQELYSD